MKENCEIMSNAINTDNTSPLQFTLNGMIEEKFPDGIYGVKNSWHDLSQMVKDFWKHPPALKPSDPDFSEPNEAAKKRRKRRKRTKKKDEGWTEVKQRPKPNKKTFETKPTPEKKQDSPPVNKKCKKYQNQGDTLVLKNLPFQGTNIISLMEVFERYGDILNINILKRDDGSCKGIAFVKFSSQRECQQALRLKSFYYNGRNVYTDRAH